MGLTPSFVPISAPSPPQQGLSFPFISLQPQVKGRRNLSVPAMQQSPKTCSLYSHTLSCYLSPRAPSSPSFPGCQHLEALPSPHSLPASTELFAAVPSEGVEEPRREKKIKWAAVSQVYQL